MSFFTDPKYSVIRHGLITAVAAGLVAMLQSLSTVNFGAYGPVITVVLVMAIRAITPTLQSGAVASATQ
jgi:hypothetical protein